MLMLLLMVLDFTLKKLIKMEQDIYYLIPKSIIDSYFKKTNDGIENLRCKVDIDGFNLYQQYLGRKTMLNFLTQLNKNSIKTIDLSDESITNKSKEYQELFSKETNCVLLDKTFPNQFNWVFENMSKCLYFSCQKVLTDIKIIQNEK